MFFIKNNNYYVQYLLINLYYENFLIKFQNVNHIFFKQQIFI